MITLKLKEREAQAILSGAETFFSELKQIDKLGKKEIWLFFGEYFLKILKKVLKKLVSNTINK